MITEDKIQSMTISDLLSSDTLDCLYDMEDRLEQTRIKALLQVRAKELGIFRAYSTMLKSFDSEQERVSRQYQKTKDIPDFFHGKQFLHNVMGDYLIKKYGVCKINGALHIYDNGVYRQGEDILHGYMIELAPTIKDIQRKEVYKYMKSSLKTPVKQPAPPYLIPFKTKIYNVETDEFLEYSPEHVFLNRFPYDYKPDAEPCESVLDTVRNIADHDEEVVNLLFESMGNCFYLRNTYRGVVILYGNGKNGKSTLLNMIIQLLGEENVSSLSLRDTGEKFRVSQLYGKAANMGDDIPDNYFPDSSAFKALVTGGKITVENKGKDPFDLQSYAKMFFAANALPPVKDKSDGFYSRILVVPLKRDFTKLEIYNPHLKDHRWTEKEMEYLTRLAVDGLKRILKNNDFTRPKTVVEAIEEYELENNPLKQFIIEFKEEHSGSLAPFVVADIYREYQIWCGSNGHKNTYSRTKFSQEVKKAENVDIRPKQINGKLQRCFFNLDSL